MATGTCALQFARLRETHPARVHPSRRHTTCIKRTPHNVLPGWVPAMTECSSHAHVLHHGVQMSFHLHVHVVRCCQTIKMDTVESGHLTCSDSLLFCNILSWVFCNILKVHRVGNRSCCQGLRRKRKCSCNVRIGMPCTSYSSGRHATRKEHDIRMLRKENMNVYTYMHVCIHVYICTCTYTICTHACTHTQTLT